jgi:hypothetical protein
MFEEADSEFIMQNAEFIMQNAEFTMQNGEGGIRRLMDL